MQSLIERFVPHQASYKLVDDFSENADLVLIGSTILTFALSVAERFDIWQEFSIAGIIINTILIVCYFFFDVSSSLIFTKAEAKRRLSFIDNSFDTKFVGERSKNYFTNDGLSPSVYKMSVNAFESAYFTHNILDKMLKRSSITSGVVVFFFLTAAIIGDQKLVRLLIEAPVMFIIIQKAVKMRAYASRVEDVLDKFKTLFNSISIDLRFTESNVPFALRNVLDYESIISWAVIPLDNKIFNVYNPILTKKWEELKAYYKIMDVNVQDALPK